MSRSSSISVPRPLLAAIMAVCTLFSSCQVYDPFASFVKQRYTNTVSYFNTFYNSQRTFNDAETEVLTAMKNARGKNGKIPTTFTTPQSARLKFTTSIEKNSKLLTFYPTCKWVDDALLMIGKAYYYLEDDLKAERKFLELIAKYPESSNIPEARLWYGRSLLREKKYTEGVKQLDILYTTSLENRDTHIAGQAALALAQYFDSIDDRDKAIKYYTLSVEVLDDDETNAGTLMLLGACYEQNQDYLTAKKIYDRVIEFSSDYATRFYSKLQSVRMSMKLKEYPAALQNLRGFLLDSKNAEYASVINLEIANVLILQGNLFDAIEKYRYVDTAYAHTDEAARAYYALGSIYSTKIVNYDSAKVMFDKAKSEFSGSDITKDATLQSDIFTKLLVLQKDMARFDSMLVSSKRQKPIQDSSVTANRDTLLRRDTTVLTVVPDSRSKQGGKGSRQRSDSLLATPIGTDSISLKLPSSQTVAPEVLIDSLVRTITRIKFEIAGIFYLEMNQPDSALYWYQSVVQHSPSSEYAPRSLYTIAEIFRTMKDSSKTTLDSIYLNIVATYPKSSYAQEARKVLGLPLLSFEADPATERYMRAENLLFKGDPDSAIVLLKSIVNDYRSSPYSSKALYAAGWLFENILRQKDSAAAIYRALVLSYPSSQYAVLVQPKLIEVENAKREEEQRIKDALAKEKKEKEEQEKKDKEERERIAKGQKGQSTPVAKETAAQADSLRSGDNAKVQPADTLSLPPH